VSWSYGLVPLDYLRHYGDEAIGGLHLVGAITKLGSNDAMTVMTPAALEAAPGLLSDDAETSTRALQAFIRLFHARERSAEELYLVLGYNAAVPPYVRQAMFGRVVDNDDVLARIRKPVLLTHGAEDAVVTLAASEQHRARIAHAELDVMAQAGHAPFQDDPAVFNARLRAFARNL
jgi:pimeloyl-ACP methyl ester carboxylesterase